MSVVNYQNSNDKKNTEKIEKNILYMLPKYERYMEYVLSCILLKLPRTEKFGIGNEFKCTMYEGLKCIVALSKIESKERKFDFLNMLDMSVIVQRIYIRIMYKEKYVDEKKYMCVIDYLAELGKMIGGYAKWLKA